MAPQVAFVLSIFVLSAAASSESGDRCCEQQDLGDGQDTLSLLQKNMRIERSRASTAPDPTTFRSWPPPQAGTGSKLEALQQRASTALGPTPLRSWPPPVAGSRAKLEVLQQRASTAPGPSNFRSWPIPKDPADGEDEHHGQEQEGQHSQEQDGWTSFPDSPLSWTNQNPELEELEELEVVSAPSSVPPALEVLQQRASTAPGPSNIRNWPTPKDPADGEDEHHGQEQEGHHSQEQDGWTSFPESPLWTNQNPELEELEELAIVSAPSSVPPALEVEEQRGSSALEGEELAGGVLGFTFAKPLETGNSVRLVADSLGEWPSAEPWALHFVDGAGNVALSWSPRPGESVVYRNSGSGSGDSTVWGLQEVQGGWPFQHGSFTLEFEWTWSLWVVSVDGIRIPGLDFYHRTSLPIISVRLTPGLTNPKLSLVDVHAAGFRRENGCDGGSGPGGGSGMPHKYRMALAGLRETHGNGLLKRGALHDVVGPHGVLMISLARKPERFLSSLPSLVAAGIVPIPFPATDAGCSSPEGLDLGMRRLAAREDLTGAKAGERARKAGQTVHEWWHETWVAQAIADSHRRALQAALARPDYEWTAILEDDAVPSGDPEAWDKSFADAWKNLGEEVKLVRLGWCGTGPPYYESFKFTPGGFRIGQWMPRLPKFDKMESGHESDGGCTTGYLVHRSIIPEILRIFPCREVVDSCFLWQVFMKPAEGPRGMVEWGSIYMANLDSSDRQPPVQGGTGWKKSHNYIQRGVLRQDHSLPSTRTSKDVKALLALPAREP